MKRLMPSSLISFLQENPNCIKADLFLITLPNGQVICATEGEWEITVPSGTPGWTGATTSFHASQYGRWNRGAITSEAGFSLAANSMALTCVPQPATSYPGLSLGILAAAFNGLFDAAQISVYTAYMPPVSATYNLIPDSDILLGTTYWQDQSVGIVTLSKGGIDGLHNCFQYAGAGSAAGYKYQYSGVIPVTAGATYTLSAFVQGINITSGNPNVRMYDSTITTLIGAFNINNGDNGRKSVTVTIPGGITQAVVLFDTNNVTVATNGFVRFQQPQLELSATASNYVTGLGTYGNVLYGLEKKFYGYIEKIADINRTHVEFECQDALYLLNQKIPSRVIQSGCPWSFCDANCTLSAATYTVTFTAKTGSTKSTLTPSSAFTQATGYFSQGVVTCTSGANAGLSQTVKLHDATGNLEMTLPWLMPVTAGDGFSVIKGCDKSTTMCGKTILPGGSNVNNLVNFGGAIAVPQPLQAL